MTFAQIVPLYVLPILLALAGLIAAAMHSRWLKARAVEPERGVPFTDAEVELDLLKRELEMAQSRRAKRLKAAMHNRDLRRRYSRK